VEQIVETRMKDLNAIDIEGATKQIEGIARSINF
jgi:ribosomal protein L11